MVGGRWCGSGTRVARHGAVAIALTLLNALPVVTLPVRAMASGVTWYVDGGPSGNNGNSCRSPQKPCKTIPGAMKKASDGDTISIAASVYSGGFSVTKSVLLAGAGAGQTIVSGGSPAMTIAGGSAVTIDGISISGGANRAGSGGGVVNDGTLAVAASEISDDSAGRNGGGIENDGTLTIDGSTLGGNSAGGDGGAIHNDGQLVVTNSTIAGNSAENAGGIWNDLADAVMKTSTVTQNSATNEGGGLFNYGTLKLEDSSIENNSATFDGGGIGIEAGTVTVSNSTVSANTASDRGGGAFHAGGTLAVDASTFAENTAQLGGAIYAFDTAALSNSTISGNAAGSSGGGIYGDLNQHVITLTNVTIAGNAAGSQGGGLAVHGRHTNLLSNTLVAGNRARGSGQSPTADCSGRLADGAGHNLVGIGDRCGLLDGHKGDLVGNPHAPIDPVLGPLQSNGGATQTMALGSGSPAIGAADVPTCQSAPIDDVDQRGVSRNAPTRSACDIGAYDTGGQDSPARRAARRSVRLPRW